MSRRVKWTEEKLDFLREYAPWHSRKEVCEEFNRRFGEEASYFAIKQQCCEQGIKSKIPHSGRFKKGQTSHNKGKKRSEWMSEESEKRCSATHFKKGLAPHNTREVGSVLVRSDGNEYVKVSDEGEERFKLKSHIVWEAAHGREVPKHHAVIHADRNKSNNDPDNLVLVSRDVLCKLNQYADGWRDRETLEAFINLVKLDGKIYKIRTRERCCKVCGDRFQPYFPKQTRCRSCIDERKSR